MCNAHGEEVVACMYVCVAHMDYKCATHMEGKWVHACTYRCTAHGGKLDACMYVYVHCTWRETGCMQVRMWNTHGPKLAEKGHGDMDGTEVEPTTFSLLAVFLKTRGMKL